MGTDYLGSISINGEKVSGKGDDLNIITGDGINVSVDPITKSLMLSSNNSGVDMTGKGATGQTLSNNYIQNGTTQQSSADFNISGSGKIGANLSVTGKASIMDTLTIGAVVATKSIIPHLDTMISLGDSTH